MHIIVSPLLTEKSAANFDKGLYVFNVSAVATKNSIADELKRLYDVDAIGIRIVNLPAKKVMFRRKPGVRNARRKAYVQLAPKQKIPGFEVQKDADEPKKGDK